MLLEIKKKQVRVIIIVVCCYYYYYCDIYDYYLPHTEWVLSQVFGQVSRLYIMASP